MHDGATLVQSSPTTRSWLRTIRDRLPQFEYREARYYAAFRTEPRGPAFAYLNPAKGSVRLFLPLHPGDEPRLQPTPSTSSWAARFPSVFPIAGEQDLWAATRLIVKSHAAIGPWSRRKARRRPEYLPSEELPSEMGYVEGAAHPVLVNAYERNRQAREKCLRHYGRTCVVCGFNFEARYGESAAGYIQVHHIVPIAQVGKEYRLNPIADLRPVCPNCHAVIHRREPPFSIEEVKHMLRKSGTHGSSVEVDVRAPGGGIG
jgi:5-methylcytosine-specific restriction endonuclease McrA